MGNNHHPGRRPRRGVMIWRIAVASTAAAIGHLRSPIGAGRPEVSAPSVLDGFMRDAQAGVAASGLFCAAARTAVAHQRTAANSTPITIAEIQPMPKMNRSSSATPMDPPTTQS